MSAAPTLPAPPITARASKLVEQADELAQLTRFRELLPRGAHPTREELAVALHTLALITKELVEIVEDLSARSLPR